VNDGLGDLRDERIISQLCAKHPARKEVVEPLDSAEEAPPRIQVDLRSTIRDLDEQAGAGVSGFRNAYMKVLGYNHADSRGRRFRSLTALLKCTPMLNCLRGSMPLTRMSVSSPLSSLLTVSAKRYQMFDRLV
jgi:hypothetical protein